MSLLIINGLTKRNDDGKGIDNINFTVEEKGIYGFFGKSGAGKTLLASVIGGLTDAQSGEIIFRDVNIRATEKSLLMAKRKIGFVPDKCHFPGDLTVLELLDFTGKTKKVDPDKRARQIKEALELTGLGDKLNKLIDALTPSEKKRLAYANALLGNPDMIIIDEPLAIIDAAQKEHIKKIIAMLGKMKIVLLFSKRSADLEDLCKYAGILQDGELLTFEAADELVARLNKTVGATLRVRMRGVDKNSILLAISDVEQMIGYELSSVGAHDMTLKLELSTRANASENLEKAIAATGAEIMSLKFSSFSLDDVIDILGVSGDADKEV